MSKPREADEATFGAAVDEIAAATERLLGALSARGQVRTREGEREKAKLRWKLREARFRPAP